MFWILVAVAALAVAIAIDRCQGSRLQAAVDHFVRWAEDVTDTLMKPYFYPELDKHVLFPQGYTAEKSGHTRGSTVDLTLFDMATEKELDMGGTFDFFGQQSHPDFGGNPATQQYVPTEGITAEQFANRMTLRQAMMRCATSLSPTPTSPSRLKIEEEAPSGSPEGESACSLRIED